MEVIEHFVQGPCVEVHRQIQTAIGEYDELLTLVKKRKLRWFGHVSRSSDLAENPKGHSERKKKKRQTERWADSIKKWTKWYLPTQLGQLKTRQDGKGLLRIHLWYLTAFQGYGIE